MNTKQRELTMLRITTFVCLGFGILGLVASFVTHAKSMLLDGLYSLIQSIFILGSGRVVNLVFKEDDEQFPFGYGAFEPFYLIVRSMVLLSMILFVGATALHSLFSGGYAVSLSLAFPVSLLSFFVCFWVWRSLARQAKLLASPVLRAESKAWMLDTLLSAASVLALVAIYLVRSSKISFLANYIDPFLTLIFLCCLSPTLLFDLIQYTKELLGAAPSVSITEDLQRIANRYVHRYDFLRSEVFASKQGRSLSVLIYIYLKEERPLRQLDAIRLEMVKDLLTYSSWCEADIIFTVDDRWIAAGTLTISQQA
ncbi:cation transporter [Sphaerochaeta sp.]|uniref:cation transporter n=1 Tax=Sphaerochaeta sp. TaxID=1972642 RepID=UPI002FC7DEE7